jgi:hypothetical protein
MFLEEPGKCWSASDLTHPNEEAASYMVFTATAFAGSTEACSIHCEVTAADLLIVTHDTTSGHSNHRCFQNDANGCECQCW